MEDVVAVARSDSVATTDTIPFFPSVLEALNLGNNAITGTLPTDLLHTRLTNLERLQLFGNDLEGTIPDFYATASLSVLWLHDNPNLTGTMPCSFVQDGVVTAATATWYDYRADCKQSQQQGSELFKARVECSCCRRCF